MRQKTQERMRGGTGFQSTHPKRDETKVDPQKMLSDRVISIHSSQAGWDHIADVVLNPIRNFNPLIPSGMRRSILKDEWNGWRSISIHSSQAGWDFPCNFLEFDTEPFQSTHPKRDETKLGLVQIHRFLISIHSSQAGWDDGKLIIQPEYQHFNPLIPSGMRLLCQQYAYLLWRISIHSSQAGWDCIFV